MSWYRRFQRLPNVPRQRYTGEIILFADSAGALKTVDEDGTVAAVAGAGSLPNPTNDGDVLTVVTGAWAGAPGGGSQPGALRVLDLGIVDVSDLQDGPVVLYANDDGDLLGPVILRDVVFPDVLVVKITREEEDDNNGAEAYQDSPAMATWQSSVHLRDGFSLSLDDDGATRNIAAMPSTFGPIGAALSSNVDETLCLAWAAATEFAEFQNLAAAGHLWYASPGGTSGGSEPDFEGNIGGTVSDGEITWNDSSALPVTGSAHVYVYAASPVVP